MKKVANKGKQIKYFNRSEWSTTIITSAYRQTGVSVAQDGTSSAYIYNIT